MKKILCFGLGVAVAGTFGVASAYFQDEGNFALWFSGAAERMNEAGVMTGYPDGTFRPENSVSRAELAVILERYDNYVADGLANLVISMESLGYLDLGDLEDSALQYKTALILAEAGYMGMLDAPADFSGDVSLDQYGEVVMEKELEGVDFLPKGYSLYRSYPYEFYLRYQGERNFGQDGWEVDQWYGPFSYYMPTFGHYKPKDRKDFKVAL